MTGLAPWLRIVVEAFDPIAGVGIRVDHPRPEGHGLVIERENG